jgi:excisionase family DNA binding protein
MNDEYININELSKLLKVTKNMIYKLIRENKIPYARYEKTLRFKKNEVLNWYLENYPTIAIVNNDEKEVMNKMSDYELLTTAQICDLLKVSYITLTRWRKQGMPYTKFGHRLVRYNSKLVEQWLSDKGFNIKG